MKQSTFKKEITARGEYGSYKAEIIATMNYSFKTISGTNSITHDSYRKTIPVHKVEIFINGKYWKAETEIPTESQLLAASDKAIIEARKAIEDAANHKTPPSFTEKMQQLFGG